MAYPSGLDSTLLFQGHGTACVGNIRCGGNDLRFGFYAAEWNSLGGDTMFVLSGD